MKKYRLAIIMLFTIVLSIGVYFYINHDPGIKELNYTYDLTILESIEKNDFNVIREVVYNYNDEYDIKLTYSEQGVVDILYNLPSDKKIKVIIRSGRTKLSYDISASNQYVYFPLQLGSGKYAIEVYENTTGTKYKKIFGEKDFLEIVDNRIVFLNTIQIIDFNGSSEVVKLTNDLIITKKIEIAKKEYGQDITNEMIESIDLEDREIALLLYDYIIQNIVYDHDKIGQLSYDYIPDILDTLETKKGICYDYSSLYAAMLRSQNIPTKLIKGYSKISSVYHAWNEVYIEDENAWIVVDTTYDAYLLDRGGDFSFEKSSTDYIKDIEY
ncbi:transglutaminase domain-containing protein [Acidaminobacter sp. JC074]|uniref:transglutaminase-like domain-containing protein n=1 Tax=Acidaminobacter sp. JC074 TaxID=2530199 RepID=UPI001F0CE855|nr:transglutaminase-like domain-containing protein [Acidaminobacter sp. JC074]MCH4889726.1 transglutaminase domain-containing protein [Acidaminobacter sp. JC074]